MNGCISLRKDLKDRCLLWKLLTLGVGSTFISLPSIVPEGPPSPLVLTVPTLDWPLSSVWAEVLNLELVQCPVFKVWRLFVLVRIQQFYFCYSVILVPKCDCIDLWNVENSGGAHVFWSIRALWYCFFAWFWRSSTKGFCSTLQRWGTMRGPGLPCDGQDKAYHAGCWSPKWFWLLKAFSSVVTLRLPQSNTPLALTMFLWPQNGAMPVLDA